MDLSTIKGWIEKRGYPVSAEEPGTLRVSWAASFTTKRPLPPMFVQVAENWIVLSVLSVEISAAYSLIGTTRALLSFNRKMPVAKFAFGAADEIVLCAELPTESLDEGELLGVIDTLLECLMKYGDYAKPPSVDRAS